MATKQSTAPILQQDGATNRSGLAIGRTWRSATYTGTAQALIAAGLVTADQIKSQKGRTEGRAVFLPSGQPCPVNKRAWREQGHKVVQQLEDGRYFVEVTLSKEEQRAGQRALRAQEQEKAELRLNQELAEKGASLIPGKLIYSTTQWFERWEGTKAQLQAADIGAGLAFPGELGAASKVHCKCPLGFPITIQRHWNDATAAVGVYEAWSSYTDNTDTAIGSRFSRPDKQFATYAPGVLQVLEQDGYGGWGDTYQGSAQALVAANLVLSLDHFPGQPGRNKVSCIFNHKGQQISGRAKGWAYSIHRIGKDKFEVVRPISEVEEKRRIARRDERNKAEQARDSAAKAERIRQRTAFKALQAGPPQPEDFRKQQQRHMERSISVMWTCFTMGDFTMGDECPYRLNLDEGTEAYEEIAGAFEALREAIENAEVITNTTVLKKIEGQRKNAAILSNAAAARQDTGLQSFLATVAKRPLADDEDEAQ